MERRPQPQPRGDEQPRPSTPVPAPLQPILTHPAICGAHDLGVPLHCRSWPDMSIHVPAPCAAAYPDHMAVFQTDHEMADDAYLDAESVRPRAHEPPSLWSQSQEWEWGMISPLGASTDVSGDEVDRDTGQANRPTHEARATRHDLALDDVVKVRNGGEFVTATVVAVDAAAAVKAEGLERVPCKGWLDEFELVPRSDITTSPDGQHQHQPLPGANRNKARTLEMTPSMMAHSFKVSWVFLGQRFEKWIFHDKDWSKVDCPPGQDQGEGRSVQMIHRPSPTPAARPLVPTHDLSVGEKIIAQYGATWHMATVIEINLPIAMAREDLIWISGSLYEGWLKGMDEIVPRCTVVPTSSGGHRFDWHGATYDVKVHPWSAEAMCSGFKVRWEGADPCWDTWLVHGLFRVVEERQVVDGRSKIEVDVDKVEDDVASNIVQMQNLMSERDKLKDAQTALRAAVQTNSLPKTASDPPSQQAPQPLIGGTGQSKPAGAASVHQTILKMLIDADDTGLSQEELEAADGVGQKHVFAFKRVANTLGMTFTQKMVRNGRIKDVIFLTRGATGFFRSQGGSNGQGTNIAANGTTGSTVDDGVGTSAQRTTPSQAISSEPGLQLPALPDGQGLEQQQQPQQQQQGAGCELEYEDVLVGMALLRDGTPFTHDHISEVLSAITNGEQAHSKISTKPRTTKRRVGETLAVLLGLGLIDQVSARGAFRGKFRCTPPQEVCLLETVSGDTAVRKICALLFDAEGNRKAGVSAVMTCIRTLQPDLAAEIQERSLNAATTARGLHDPPRKPDRDDIVLVRFGLEHVIGQVLEVGCEQHVEKEKLALVSFVGYSNDDGDEVRKEYTLVPMADIRTRLDGSHEVQYPPGGRCQKIDIHDITPEVLEGAFKIAYRNFNEIHDEWVVYTNNWSKLPEYTTLDEAKLPSPKLLFKSSHGLSAGDMVDVMCGNTMDRARVIHAHMAQAVSDADLVLVVGQGVRRVVPRCDVIVKPGGGYTYTINGTTYDVQIISWSHPLICSGFEVRSTSGGREYWVVGLLWQKVRPTSQLADDESVMIESTGVGPEALAQGLAVNTAQLKDLWAENDACTFAGMQVQAEGAGCELEYEDVLVGMALLRHKTPFTHKHISEVLSAIKGEHAHSKITTKRLTTKRRVGETLAVLLGLGVIDKVPASQGTFRGTFRCTRVLPDKVCLLETVSGDTAACKIRGLLFDAEGNRIPDVCTSM